MPICVVRGCANETGGALQCRDCREGQRPGALPGEAERTPTPSPSPAVLRREEAEEQAEGIRRLELYGFQVWRVGQRDARGTMDAGVSDVIAFAEGVVVFWEAKRSHDWRQSAEQKRFMRACEAAGVTYLLGPAVVVERWLLERARRTA